MLRSISILLAALALVASVSLAQAQSAPAEFTVYISSTGTGTSTTACSAFNPCRDFTDALNSTFPNGHINCLNEPVMSDAVALAAITIDCKGVYLPVGGGFSVGTNSAAVRIRNLTFTGSAQGSSAIIVTGGGDVVIENCVFENFAGLTPILIEPDAPLNLVIRNTRISNNGGGMLIKPTSNGSVTATFDHVTVTQNGGGIHADSSIGPVNVAISDSTISANTANGVNVTSGVSGGSNNVFNITRTTIAENGLVGVGAVGGNAAVLLDTTLLDSNAGGATVAGNSGRILSYGNNRIVGSAGSGFTGSASLQ